MIAPFTIFSANQWFQVTHCLAKETNVIKVRQNHYLHPSTFRSAHWRSSVVFQCHPSNGADKHGWYRLISIPQKTLSSWVMSDIIDKTLKLGKQCPCRFLNIEREESRTLNYFELLCLPKFHAQSNQIYWSVFAIAIRATIVLFSLPLAFLA